MALKIGDHVRVYYSDGVVRMKKARVVDTNPLRVDVIEGSVCVFGSNWKNTVLDDSNRVVKLVKRKKQITAEELTGKIMDIFAKRTKTVDALFEAGLATERLIQKYTELK
jgi:hypothetical protein